MILERDGLVVGQSVDDENSFLYPDSIKNIRIFVLINRIFVVAPAGCRVKNRYATISITNFNDGNRVNLSRMLAEPFVDMFLEDRVPDGNNTGSLYFWGYR